MVYAYRNRAVCHHGQEVRLDATEEAFGRFGGQICFWFNLVAASLSASSELRFIYDALDWKGTHNPLRTTVLSSRGQDHEAG